MSDVPDGLSAAQKRLQYRATRRSMLEMEHLLGRLLAQHLSQWDDAMCERMLVLLQEPDGDLLDWLGGLQESPPRVDPGLIAMLAEYRRG